MKQNFSCVLRFFFLSLLIIGSFILPGCGGGTAKPPTPVANNAFAYLQEEQPGVFTQMLGRFVSTDQGLQFQSTAIIDPSTKQPISGRFGSIYLSKAGDKLAFDVGIPHSEGDYEYYIGDIFISNSDGTGLTRITNDDYADASPQFSPDGKWVVFNSIREDVEFGGEVSKVVIRSVDNPSVGEQVLPTPPGTYNTWHPSFSPDGNKIVVGAGGENDGWGWFSGLLVMNKDGSHIKMIADLLAWGFDWLENPVFTPDGKQIVCASMSYSQITDDTRNIVILDANTDCQEGGCGSGDSLTKGVDVNNLDLQPLLIHVNGLGNRIIFLSNRDHPGGDAYESSRYELYMMDLDGSGVMRLTDNEVFDGFSTKVNQAHP